MSQPSDQVLRLEGKLASIARTGRTAMVCFMVRADPGDLGALLAAKDADLLLGVVIASEIATADGPPE